MTEMSSTDKGEDKMDRYLKLSFDNIKGRNCEHCMLSFSRGEHNHCAALGSRPICPEEGCRKDCPLIDKTKIVDLPVLDANDERYKEVMTYNKCIFADYTRNDYRDLFKGKNREEIIAINAEIERMINNMRRLHEGLLQKKSACESLLEE